MMDLDKVYPGIDEIIPGSILVKMPYTLVEEIKERYSGLGTKYLTNDQMPDGRFINACMNKSSIQDALEEVIDAVFNILVAIFKISNDNSEEGFTAGMEMTEVLIGLMEIYSLLKVLQIRYYA